MSKYILILCAVMTLTACTEEQDPQEEQYCSMVKRWKLDAAAGVAPKNRTGWPPFKGECK